MPLNRVNMVMIMLAGLLVLASPVVPQHAVAQAPGVDKLLGDAAAAQDRAAKAYADTMTKMNAVKSMPNTDENEKTIVATLQQVTDTVKTLLDANKATLDALKELRHIQK
jgi:hypothetical protein